MVRVNTPFDLAILGSGPGGYVAAIRAGQLGLRTALVEKDPHPGGTCLHRGCIPTKSLLETAYLLDRCRQGAEFGVETAGVRLNLAKAHERKSKVIARLTKGVEGLLRKNKVTLIRGVAMIESPRRVRVDPVDDAGPTFIDAARILIATGSVPLGLPGIRPDGRRILTSDHMLDVPEVPSSLLVVGAGAVGVEFASIFSSFGAQVTIVEMLPRLIPLEDEALSLELRKAFERRKIAVRTGTRVEGIEVTDGAVETKVADAGGESEVLKTEMVLVAAGRRAVTEGIGLERTRIKVEKGRIAVGEDLETDEPGVYAVGDVVPGPQLAHYASAQGRVAVEAIAGRNPRPVDTMQVPRCVYSHPEVAGIGRTEAEARAQGHDVRTGVFPLASSGRAAILGETHGFVKIVSEKRYGEILGVHIIGPHATELIAEASTALRLESTAEELGLVIHAHPTVSESVMEAAHAVFGQAIHV